MNQGITAELHFFLISVLWGLLVLLAYDQLRIIRRVIRHSTFIVAIQDMIFWIMASVFIFAMIYVKNSGTIRGFSVMGIAIGMTLYHYILSDWIVKLLSRLILLLLSPFYIVVNYIRKGIGFIKNELLKLNNRVYSQLKRKAKSVKISLSNHKKRKAKSGKKSLSNHKKRKVKSTKKSFSNYKKRRTQRSKA